MRYIEPSFEEIKEADPINKIALVAHNCYQVDHSPDEKLFVIRLLSFRHYAMVEHMMFQAEVEKELFNQLKELSNRFIILEEGKGRYYASFSLRPILEEEHLTESPLINLAYLLNDDLLKILNIPSGKKKGHLLTESEVDQLDEPIYSKMKNVTIRIVTDRGVTHEIVRHRLASYAQESTRYCNYSKNKFGNELTFIKPLDYNKFSSIYDKSFKEAEDNYFELLAAGSTPEMARAVLPNKLKATIVMTANIQEWKTFFELRCSERAHPDMRQIACPLNEYFKKSGYLK